jgi:hypothetical protein
MTLSDAGTSNTRNEKQKRKKEKRKKGGINYKKEGEKERNG